MCVVEYNSQLAATAVARRSLRVVVVVEGGGAHKSALTKK